MKWVYKSSENIGSFLQQRSFWDLKMQLMFNVQGQRKRGGSGGPADVLPVLFFPGKISLILVGFRPFSTIFGHFWQLLAVFFDWFLAIFTTGPPKFLELSASPESSVVLSSYCPSLSLVVSFPLLSVKK